MEQLRLRLGCAQVSPTTWMRHYLPPFNRLVAMAGQQQSGSDRELLKAVLRRC
ncbi:hypothetical protein [Synechococcus sp. GFB01]|uniref:hypothetical protein n=1 Tax=Synechococcus sp. GFB01 TaxID=1662190 RepID=UPI0013792739|nr:hypothetical protein [Synechococcus sp. GFB01]